MLEIYHRPCLRSSVFYRLCGLVCALWLAMPIFAEQRDIFPDTWVGHDALGRLMPTSAEVGALKNDQRRVVGMFYVTWHSDSNAGLKSPYAADVSRILTKDAKARLDARHPLWTEGSYHWGEPEDGYFLSKDEYVIRKDMSMLADAGVDVLVMDVTNAVEYWEEWDVIFPVMEKMKAEGNKVPQFCFWAFNGPVITVVQNLYDRIYKIGKYKDLWFHWDDKPLLLYNGTPKQGANGPQILNPNPHNDAVAAMDPKHPHHGNPDYTEKNYSDYTAEVKEFFTRRTMWWGYHTWAGQRFIGTEDHWSFGLDLGDPSVRALRPDELVSTHQGKKEEAAVTPAQHASSMIGKSWSRARGQPALNDFDLPRPTFVPWLGRTVEHPENYGIYFQERWDEALSNNPQFLYINDWNEWTAGKYQPENGKTFPFMGRASSFLFVDQYNAEFNRSIQPMKGGCTDNYYMQMVQNIRRYKGVRSLSAYAGYQSMVIDGQFDDWSVVKFEFRDTVGDTFHRKHAGYGGLQYENDSGRNDIITSKVSVDSGSIYFYVETTNGLTPCTGKNWMLLLIDADQNPATGWCGYDFIINQRVVDDRTTMLQRHQGSAVTGPWLDVAPLAYRAADRRLELAVPRALLGMEGDAVAFDFKWSDHPADLKDPISLCTHGDSAPNRRFNYRMMWKLKQGR